MLRMVKILGWLFLLSAMTQASEPSAGGDAAPWQGVVCLDAAPVYSGVSAARRVVTLLKRGETVNIALEIAGEDGKWYAVTGTGQSGVAGYVNGKALDVPEPETVANWEYQPPPEPTPELPAGDEHKAVAAASRARIQGDIKRLFASNFGRTLPVSAFGQTNLHSRLGFDHRNGIDVALHPDSLEGRALIAKLRSLTIPFIAFRRAIPGVATGAHIHVGNPSPRK
jgi:hypothetical protein